MNIKRERLDIINNILEVISNTKNISITNLLHKSNISLQCEEEYEKELVEKGFMKIITLPKGSISNGRKSKKESKSFEITEKGIEYLKFYKKLTAFKKKYDL